MHAFNLFSNDLHLAVVLNFLDTHELIEGMESGLHYL